MTPSPERARVTTLAPRFTRSVASAVATGKPLTARDSPSPACVPMATSRSRSTRISRSARSRATALGARRAALRCERAIVSQAAGRAGRSVLLLESLLPAGGGELEDALRGPARDEAEQVAQIG